MDAESIRVKVARGRRDAQRNSTVVLTLRVRTFVTRSVTTTMEFPVSYFFMSKLSLLFPDMMSAFKSVVATVAYFFGVSISTTPPD